jgi:hypothetical protein
MTHDSGIAFPSTSMLFFSGKRRDCSIEDYPMLAAQPSESMTITTRSRPKHSKPRGQLQPGTP